MVVPVFIAFLVSWTWGIYKESELWIGVSALCCIVLFWLIGSGQT